MLKVEIDSEKSKSMYKMTLDRENFIKTLEINDNSATIITENYYEVIKELGTIILLLDGLKASGDYAHKETIDYLQKINIFDEGETSFVQDLRTKRNYSSYEGKRISKEYILERRKNLEQVISKLRKAVEKRLKKF